MKLKKILVALMLSSLIFAASCNNLGKAVYSEDIINESTGETTDEPINSDEEEKENQNTQETEEADTYSGIGIAYKVGDWEVTVNSIEFADEVLENQFISFNPGEGNLYLVINMSVTNKGKKTDSFQKSVLTGNYVDIKLIYDGEYEYEPIYLSEYSNSFDSESIPALSFKTGDIIIKLPELIRTEKEKNELILTYSKDKIVYILP